MADWTCKGCGRSVSEWKHGVPDGGCPFCGRPKSDALDRLWCAHTGAAVSRCTCGTCEVRE